MINVNISLLTFSLVFNILLILIFTNVVIEKYKTDEDPKYLSIVFVTMLIALLVSSFGIINTIIYLRHPD